MKSHCLLCAGTALLFFTDQKSEFRYYHCPQCDLRFTDPTQHLSAGEEKKRYENHENDIEDPGYQKFLSPLKDLIVSKRQPSERGLDFGCGSGPVLAHLLRQAGFSVSLYDPYFYPDREALEKEYDFISATEVIEHLYHPEKEFQMLRKILKPGGSLALMTHIFDEKIDFESWYYRRDPTHVCFYSAKTFDWIKDRFGFRSFTQHGERIAWLESL